MNKKSNPFSIPEYRRKINPGGRIKPGRKPDGTPDDNERIEIGPTQLAFDEWLELGIEMPSLEAMRQYRIARVRKEMNRLDMPAVLLFDPLNIRYAVDATNMQVWVAHNMSRACFIPQQGPVTLWEFYQCQHLTKHLPIVEELRYGAGFIYFIAGPGVRAMAENFAVQVNELMNNYCGKDRRLAVDKIEIAGLRALESLGIEVAGGQELIEQARVIKDNNEINAIRCSLAATETSMTAMKDNMQPGMTENELWATLHYEIIRRGGEWIETRLLASGPRTNPWFQECGPRVIQEGDLVAFDTDLIGPYGYCADISRTWYCGDGAPDARQREMYKLAYEELQFNIQLVKPGAGFRELSEKSFPLPDKYAEQRYAVLMHGIGLCDEYPAIFPPDTYKNPLINYDGVFQPGMTLSIESYIGAVGEKEGVKLEEQVLVTETGSEILSHYPFEAELL